MLRSKPMCKMLKNNIKYSSTISLKRNADSISSATLKSWKDIPGPTTLPILGQLHHFLPGGSLYKKQGYDMWNMLYNTYGPIIRMEAIFKPPTIVIYDPKYIAEIFHSENWSPVRPAFFTLKYFRTDHHRTEEEANRSSGLVIDHGKKWRYLRTKVNPVLMMPKVIQRYAEEIDEVAVDVVERIKSMRDDQNMIQENLMKLMNLWSLESIGVIALGQRLNCFDPNLDSNSPAMTLINCTHDLFDIADKLDYRPSIWKYFATPTFRRAMRIYRDIENSTTYFVQQAIEDLKSGKMKSGKEESVLEKLLDIDEYTAILMASDMLIAGVDTTSNTALSLLYLLAKNPEKQHKLREEVTTFGGRRPYLKACLKEALRLMPTVGLNFRVTTKEYNIMDYKIPKNMGIIFCHHVISLWDSYYPRATEFIPERWLVGQDDPLYYGNTHPFVHLPFGFGVRTCVGRRIAELEVESLVTRLVESFDIQWDGPPPLVTFSHVNYVRGPYNYVFNDIIKKE